MPQAVRPLIRKRFGRIETDTPYSQRWVNAIKACVPPHYREWNTASEMWSFDPAAYELVRAITCDQFGDDQVVDLVGDIRAVQFAGWQLAWETYKARRDTGGRANNGSGFWEDIFNRARQERSSGMPWSVSPDPWSTLFVTRDAPWEVIKASYRALSLLHHPDRGGSEARMQAINAAYEDLKQRQERGTTADEIPFG